MSEIAIHVEGLSKRYRIGKFVPYRSLRESLVRIAGAPFRLLSGKDTPADPSRETWALKDVSFDVIGGEVLGIIGRNGAGKSTLLRILSRITDPTEGRAEVRGRIRALLEVGTGFHPELTGRENIYLNGAILGMRKAEIARKFDEIVAFSEVERFLDTAVKHYSSGMYMRLAFAVAAHLEPEILLVDEVLAVGDASFQKKCLGKMEGVAKSGRTVLFVSHNMGAIQSLCSRSVLLDQGRVSRSGATSEVLQTYLQEQPPAAEGDLSTRTLREGTGEIRWSWISILNDDRRPSTTFLSGKDLHIRLRYVTEHPIPPGATILVAIIFKDVFDRPLFPCNNELTGEITDGWPEHGEVTCTIPRLPLTTGTYKIDLYISSNGTACDWILDAASIVVEDTGFFGTGRVPHSSHGSFLVPHRWMLQSPARNPSREVTP